MMVLQRRCLSLYIFAICSTSTKGKRSFYLKTCEIRCDRWPLHRWIYSPRFFQCQISAAMFNWLKARLKCNGYQSLSVLVLSKEEMSCREEFQTPSDPLLVMLDFSVISWWRQQTTEGKQLSQRRNFSTAKDCTCSLTYLDFIFPRW